MVSKADGWYSQSKASGIKESLIKSTAYARATADELSTMQGQARDMRAALVQAKLVERDQYDV